MEENKWELIKELNGLKESARTLVDPTELGDIEEKILKIQNKLQGIVSYDDCVDITKKDPSDKILKNTGKLPVDAFIETLKKNGFSDEEIYNEEVIYSPKRVKIRKWDKLNKERIYIEKEVPFPSTKKSGIFVDYGLLPEEKIRKLKKNTKMGKKHPDKTHTYELIRVPVFKYKNVLIKLGIDISEDDYWNNLKENMK